MDKIDKYLNEKCDKKLYPLLENVNVKKWYYTYSHELRGYIISIVVISDNINDKNE